jgi:DNA-binding CsgD family transcriptional regulator
VAIAAFDAPAVQSTSADVLDALGVPLFLIQPNRTIAHANPPGLRLLDVGHLFYATRGNLACRDAESNSALEAALREIDSGAIDRKVVRLHTRHGATIPCVLKPVKQGNYILIAVLELYGIESDAEVIAAAFQLTAAEARIAAAVSAGNNPQQCAALLNIKVSTVRTQLVSVFRKTGTTSQAHLARLILPLTIFSPSGGDFDARH